MTQEKRLQALLNLLDDVIAKDEERTTKGEWIKDWGRLRDNNCESVCQIPEERREKFQGEEWFRDADFIACASVSHGRNARALKAAIKSLSCIYNDSVNDEGTWQRGCAGDALASILSNYPDELLKRYASSTEQN